MRKQAQRLNNLATATKLIRDGAKPRQIGSEVCALGNMVSLHRRCIRNKEPDGEIFLVSVLLSM